MDSILMYDDDNECGGDQCFADYDDEYFQNQESVVELYQYCISPTLNNTFWYLVPLILVSLSCNIVARIRK